MWKIFLYSPLIFYGIKVSGFGFSEMLLGPGKWKVINVQKCATDDLMPSKVDISRRKINRTCDGFTGTMTLKETIDSTYSILLEVCKFVDGGCKPFQKMEDESFERFAKKYGGDNLVELLKFAGIIPPDFPIPAGDYKLESPFAVNYNALPEKGAYGEYGAEVFIVKDGVKRMCIYVHAKFTHNEEN